MRYDFNLPDNPATLARFVLENVALRTIGAVAPPYWALNKTTIDAQARYKVEQMSDAQLMQIVSNSLGMPMAMPLWIGYSWNKEKAWLLPFEPLVSLTGQNVIVRRNVAKAAPDRTGRGTVKERWAQNDYAIRIEGWLMDADNNRYPREDVARLRELCEAREALYVKCELFEIFGIDHLVIENFEIPFTRGNNNQTYVITGYSDDIFTLLVDEKGLQ